MDVRPEIRMDERSIDEVHALAFPNGGPSEVAMVHELRDSPAFLPELSLVAVEGGVIVGHILVTLVHYVPDDRSFDETPVLSLAPLAVRPSHQDQGIGGRLVDVALRRASLRPEPFMVVLGHPSYYPRFGFRRADELGIRCPFPGASDGAYMVRRLPGFRPVATPGTVRYYSPET
ncbi:MAG TPA: N-acetyltransferase [Acidimicrobiales bacterium]|nr:N-acetyltransferase [Acidimicrobiales bacterium]